MTRAVPASAFFAVLALAAIMAPAFAQSQPTETTVNVPDESAEPVYFEFPYLAPADAPKLLPAPKRYSPPASFANRAWGEPRSAFGRLPDEAAAISAAWRRGEQVKGLTFCTGTGRTYAAVIDSTVPRGGAIGGGPSELAGCSWSDIGNSLRRNLQGGGYYILSEYLIDKQGFKFPRTGVLLHPAVYEFCAHWEFGKGEIPDNFDALNTFCGMRLLFETETQEELRKLPEDQVTQYDLVLAELTSRYGKPDDILWRGRVYVETLDGDKGPDTSVRQDREFPTRRWCPMPDERRQKLCDISIVLSADPRTGKGIVIFGAPGLWQYAEAREKGLGLPDPLFTLLHGLSFKDREDLRQARLAEIREAEQKEAQKKAAKERRRSKLPERRYVGGL
jgi:hypothetical protein